MENQVNLETIFDIKELKALKSDQYDLIDDAQRQMQASQQNLQVLNARIIKLTEYSKLTEKDLLAKKDKLDK